MNSIYNDSFFYEIGMSKCSFDEYLKDAPKKYKVYKIKKRNGGYRTIAHPARHLKDIQRATVKRLENVLPVHQNAIAYRKNKSIKDNALMHIGAKHLLKMDFYDFFNSINNRIFFSLFERYGYTDDHDYLNQTLFWQPRQSNLFILSVGAPSSPLVSNAIMFSFDEVIANETERLNINYSRYADDLTFSGESEDALLQMIPLTKKTLHQKFEGQIIVNDLKTKLISPGANKFVTGVTLTNQGLLSIGRKRKRLIFSLVHRYSLGKLSEEERSYLKGLLAFAKDIEPQLIVRLETKYGISVMEALKRSD